MFVVFLSMISMNPMYDDVAVVVDDDDDAFVVDHVDDDNSR
jgi:hypothetical protein